MLARNQFKPESFNSNVITTGNKDIDNVIDGYGKEISLIYGPGASGKTTLVKLAAMGQLKLGKKVVFVDTENSFSVDRFMQLCGPNYLYYLNRLLLLKANGFDEQCRRIDSLIRLVDIDLIVIDSLGIHYRKEVRNNPKEINTKMDRQLRILTEITRKGIPVLITNQVSQNPETGEIKSVGGDMVKNWVKRLIELKKDPRRIFLIRPEERSAEFEIVNEGIKILAR